MSWSWRSCSAALGWSLARCSGWRWALAPGRKSWLVVFAEWERIGFIVCLVRFDGRIRVMFGIVDSRFRATRRAGWWRGC